jgi:hypothetical protein
MTSFKFFRFLCAASVLLTLAGSPALAADDLPPPADGTLDELPAAPDAMPQPAPSADDLTADTPPPSLGEDTALPAPSGAEPESGTNVVNQTETPDNIFLPAPGGDINLAPVSNAAVTAPAVYSGNDSDWHSSMSRRPVFSLAAGGAVRNYPTTLVEGMTTGYAAQASLRLFDLGQTVFAHAFGGISMFDVGDVGIGTFGPSYGGVHDTTYHLGGMIEIGLGRRISLYGSIARRWNHLTYEPATGPNADGIRAQRNPAMLEFIGEAPSMQLGVGAQYDFYVIPHGSIGLQGRIERDFYYVGLTMSMEPAPRKKLSLNFDSIDQ